MKRSWLAMGCLIATVMVVAVVGQDPEKKETRPTVPRPGVDGPGPGAIDEGPPRNPPGNPADWVQVGPNGWVPRAAFAPATVQIRNAYGLVNQYSTFDPELQKAIAEYRQAEGETNKAEKLAAVTKKVTEQFEAREKVREAELAQLEANLKRLREVHAKRGSEKETIVKDRVRQLIRDSEGLGWGDSGASAPRYTEINAVPQGSGVIRTPVLDPFQAR